MKCPNCGEALKDSAKVCFSCGEDVSKHELDHIIQDIIKEEDKIKNANKKSINSSDNEAKAKVVKVKELGQAARITGYINAIVIVLLLASFLMSWFTLGGRGAFRGFIMDERSSQFMTKEVMSLPKSEIEVLDPSIGILSFSAIDLMDFAKYYEEDYKMIASTDGELKQSWVVIIQFIYIKGLYVISILSLLGILLLILDRKLILIEWIRGFSVISMVILGLNFLAFKIPFFSMIALRGQSLLRQEDILSAVKLSLKGISVNKDIYPYELVEKQGFFLALVMCGLWFILSTVLVEMKRDKEYNKIIS